MHCALFAHAHTYTRIVYTHTRSVNSQMLLCWPPWQNWGVAERGWHTTQRDAE